MFPTTIFSLILSYLCSQSALTSVFWLTRLTFPFPPSDCLSLYRQTALQHIEPPPLCALHLIFICSMKADSMPSSQTPCVKSVVSLLKICSDGRPDLTQSHIAPEMQIVDTLPLASPTVCFLFFIIVFLIQTKEKEALKQAAFNMSRHSNIYPCRIQLRFSPLFFSRSRSSKALKLLLSFFHNNVPDIINLSQCSCHTMLCVRLCRGGGREDRYKWHQSQAGSSLGLPSDAAFYSGGSPSC